MRSLAEAKKRSVDRARRENQSMVRSAKLPHGKCVIVEFDGSGQRRFELEIAFVHDDKLAVGGCVSSSAAFGRILSEPFSYIEPKLIEPGKCILADASELHSGNVGGIRKWYADGTEVKDICRYIADKTPMK